MNYFKKRLEFWLLLELVNNLLDFRLEILPRGLNRSSRCLPQKTFSDPETRLEGGVADPRDPPIQMTRFRFSVQFSVGFGLRLFYESGRVSDRYLFHCLERMFRPRFYYLGVSVIHLDSLTSETGKPNLLLRSNGSVQKAFLSVLFTVFRKIFLSTFF